MTDDKDMFSIENNMKRYKKEKKTERNLVGIMENRTDRWWKRIYRLDKLL